MIRSPLTTAIAAVASLLLAACAALPRGVVEVSPGPFTAVLTLPSGRSVTVDPKHLDYRGRARLEWPDGRIYDGAFRNGVPEGRGREVLADASTYHGEWRHGERDGSGELVGPDGARYVGEFAAGVRQGIGTLTASDGVYRGHWWRDVPEGEGVFEGSDGSRYDGEWQRGLRFGYGSYRTADGSSYEGDWAYDEPEGFGCLQEDGSVYDGGWREGKREGYGRAEGPPGLAYEGTWVAGHKQGFGREQRPDGSSYVGRWMTDKRDGPGLEVRADGSFHDGSWELDRALGPGRRRAPTGIEISGAWNGDSVSTGLLTLPTGLTYAGPLFGAAATRASPRLVSWLHATAADGDPYAQLMLGTLYLDMDQPSPDVDRARHWLDPAARAGLAEAQYRLALTYEHIDAPRVVELLAEAGRQAHPQANETLGEYYYGGITVPRNLERAIGYYQQAVDGGSITARNNLAWLLATADQPRHRDGARAVALIRPIALYSGHWQYLDTLAAALAAAGNFDQAVAIARRAIAAAGHDPNAQAEAAGLERRLAGYRAGRAYVEPAP